MGMLTDEERMRYSRQLVIPEIGEAGQEKLRAAKVLVVGAGGLGSPAAMYLAAAGVGTLGLVDSDVVDLSNLQRQILHGVNHLGLAKVESGKRALARLNPGVHVVPARVAVTPENVSGLIGPYDVVVDAVDNLETRYVVNDACVKAGKPLIEAGVLRFDGMVLTVLPGRGPCYRCVFPTLPPPGVVPSCREAGIIGAVPGVVGSIEALEAIKVILGLGQPLVGRLLLFDGLAMTWREVSAARDPNCPACGGGRG
ncbi:MAG: HesA/MoeB/ThiF family protein [Bacteroidota bacterium]